MELKDLEKEIENIKIRNARVELDKKWETCWTRKICICILTYIVVIAYSYIVRNYSNILLSSLVPVIGFTLSTLSLKYIRKIMYTTNAIESLNSTYKRINRNRNVFPTDMSLLKVLYLSTLKAEKKWSRMVDKWDLCLSQFRIMYEGRI